jgi:NAD-dependent dihydropyrimidine dehydrogenase PreA subunit/bacterioferritin-associated ferredoxin
MIVREYVPKIDMGLCKRCRKCEKICPAGSIMYDSSQRSMNMDPDRCIDCQRCMDACASNAISMHPRANEFTLGVDYKEMDQLAIKSLCRKVGLMPDEAVCACTFITAQEVAGAILKGATSPEDICAMTGIRRGCGIYCLVNIFRILEAAEIHPPPMGRSYLFHHPLSPLDLDNHTLEKIHAEFPHFHIKEDVEMMRKCRKLHQGDM